EHGRRGGPPGDLYVVLQVRPHKQFRRDGSTVLSRATISYPQAVLGSSVEVDTLHGKSTLDIPAGTQHGRDFRLRGQGIPRLDGAGKGDHVVSIEVEVPQPRDLSPEELQLLRRLAELGGHPVKEEKGVIERVKNLFG
ncbi:MAG TPA: DnaJ C-terminal domain-containing protein, partial [Thermoanaerobaculia bacterium]